MGSLNLGIISIASDILFKMFQHLAIRILFLSLTESFFSESSDNIFFTSSVTKAWSISGVITSENVWTTSSNASKNDFSFQTPIAKIIDYNISGICFSSRNKIVSSWIRKLNASQAYILTARGIYWAFVHVRRNPRYLLKASSLFSNMYSVKKYIKRHIRLCRTPLLVLISASLWCTSILSSRFIRSRRFDILQDNMDSATKLVSSFVSGVSARNNEVLANSVRNSCEFDALGS